MENWDYFLRKYLALGSLSYLHSAQERSPEGINYLLEKLLELTASQDNERKKQLVSTTVQYIDRLIGSFTEDKLKQTLRLLKYSLLLLIEETESRYKEIIKICEYLNERELKAQYFKKHSNYYLKTNNFPAAKKNCEKSRELYKNLLSNSEIPNPQERRLYLTNYLELLEICSKNKDFVSEEKENFFWESLGIIKELRYKIKDRTSETLESLLLVLKDFQELLTEDKKEKNRLPRTQGRDRKFIDTNTFIKKDDIKEIFESEIPGKKIIISDMGELLCRKESDFEY